MKRLAFVLFLSMVTLALAQDVAVVPKYDRIVQYMTAQGDYPPRLPPELLLINNAQGTPDE